MSAIKRIQVSFTEKQYEMLKNFKGEFGDSDAEVIRNIIMAWLAEKSFISDTVKKRMNNDKNE